MSSLSIDFETRATVDLKKTGVYPYAEHPDTDIWCMAWAFDDEEPEIWTPSDPLVCENDDQPYHLPDRILKHIEAGGEIRAWNAQFERIIWNHIMVKRYGAPPVKLEQWVDSAAEAAAMALPRALDQAARVLGVQQQKDKDGYSLMLRMTRPRKIHDDGRIEWWDVPDRLERLYDYCKQDVRTERAIIRCLRRLTDREREVYLLDQRMNDRGIQLDRSLVVAAKTIVDEGVARANATMRELTDGEVTQVTNSGRLRTWLTEQGVDGSSVSKAAVRDLLDSDLTPAVRSVLETRTEAGRSSIAKLDRMLAYACQDDRLRGLLFYHAASTGRWGGRGVQPQNFPRGEVDDIEDYIPAVLAGDYDFLDLFAPPIVIVSTMLRAMLTAALGYELIAADYSAIEARVLNWLAGQHDMVANFSAYDAGDKTRDPYIQNAMRLYGIPFAQVQKFPHRQTGKFQELGCGYGMGAKKAVTAAKDVYQLVIDEERAKEIVDSYRATHPAVVDFWYEADRAVIAAVSNPGAVQTFGAYRNVKAVKAGAYLYLVLPSGRPLCYAAPKVVDAPTPWGELKPAVEFSGVDSYTKQWGRMRLYGGLIVENVVQAVSRDLMAEGMLRLEAAGYPPILSVHDEVVSEVPVGFGSVEEFESILSTLPAWAAGCPVTAEGWRGARYRK